MKCTNKVFFWRGLLKHNHNFYVFNYALIEWLKLRKKTSAIKDSTDFINMIIISSLQLLKILIKTPLKAKNIQLQKMDLFILRIIRI